MNNFDNNVTTFFNDFHRKVTTRPNLYASHPTMMTVFLPESLLEYANAAAGHSGFGSGARAGGIRRKVSDSRTARDEIFSSVESLTAFLLSSECDAADYIKSVKARHASGVVRRAVAKQIETDERLIDSKGGRTLMSRRYGSNVFVELARRFTSKVVNNDIRTLTINEFELRYGMAA
jgi:hypothetical protein